MQMPFCIDISASYRNLLLPFKPVKYIVFLPVVLCLAPSKVAGRQIEHHSEVGRLVLHRGHGSADALRYPEHAIDTVPERIVVEVIQAPDICS
jgi:hypothetical protein